jgi:hypothetical protein
MSKVNIGCFGIRMGLIPIKFTFTLTVEPSLSFVLVLID